MFSAGFPLSALGAETGELAVIVHPSNRSKVSKDDLGFIFKSSMRHWSDGGRIAALNLPARTNERALFDHAVLGLDPDAVARFWIDRKIRGGEPPPRTIMDALTMARVVQQLRDAIGYVPIALATEKVRIVARVRASGVVGTTNFIADR